MPTGPLSSLTETSPVNSCFITLYIITVMFQVFFIPEPTEPATLCFISGVIPILLRPDSLSYSRAAVSVCCAPSLSTTMSAVSRLLSPMYVITSFHSSTVVPSTSTILSPDIMPALYAGESSSTSLTVVVAWPTTKAITIIRTTAVSRFMKEPAVSTSALCHAGLLLNALSSSESSSSPSMAQNPPIGNSLTA